MDFDYHRLKRVVASGKINLQDDKLILLKLIEKYEELKALQKNTKVSG